MKRKIPYVLPQDRSVLHEGVGEQKYSIPIYEDNIKTQWTVDGIIGDDKYLEIIKMGNGKNLPTSINIKLKK